MNPQAPKINFDSIKVIKKPKQNVESYLEQYGVLGVCGEINCDNMSQILYSTFLNKFQKTMTKNEYYYFEEYQERIYNLIDSLREMTSATIPVVFDHLDKNNNFYLLDNIIMMWCLPRASATRSKQKYDKIYKENIEKYNCKIIKNINHYTIKNFCIETMTKNNNVPVHCIDYIWYYMNCKCVEFAFCNMESGKYIGFTVEELSPEEELERKNTDVYFEICLNMEYVLLMGLGKAIYPELATSTDTVSDISNIEQLSKGQFRDLLRFMITDLPIVKLLKKSSTFNNYKKQVINMSKDVRKYFGDILESIPQDVIDEIQIVNTQKNIVQPISIQPVTESK